MYFITFSASCGTEQIYLPGGYLLKPFGKPNLDDGLARHTEPTGFPIEGFKHPVWKIHIDSSLFLQKPARL
jgi:hypothetical protein